MILRRDKEEGAKVVRSSEAPDSVKAGLRVKMVISCQLNLPLCPLAECVEELLPHVLQNLAKPNLHLHY